MHRQYLFTLARFSLPYLLSSLSYLIFSSPLTLLLTLLFSLLAQLLGFDIAYNIETQSTFLFRQCVDGEILVGNQCLECPSGSYSFHYDPLHPTTQCTECPPFTDGCYGTVILASPGYWRIDKHSVVMMPCPYGKAACHGGGIGIPLTSRPSPSEPETGEYVSLIIPESSSAATAPTMPDSTDSPEGCALGYEGPLCAVCSDNFYASASSGSCNACGGQGAQQLAIMILLPVVLLILAAYVTFSNFLARDIHDNDFAVGLLGTRSMNMGTAGNDLGMAQSLYKAAYEHEREVQLRREQGETAGKFRSFIERATEHLTFLVVVITPKVKIMLTVFQIVSGFPFSLNLEYTTVSAKLFHAFR